MSPITIIDIFSREYQGWTLKEIKGLSRDELNVFLRIIKERNKQNNGR